MTNIEPVRSEAQPSTVPALMRGAVVVAGMALLLAGCGHGQNQATTSAPTSGTPAATSAAPGGSAAPAALPTQPTAAPSSTELAMKAAAAAKAKLSSMSVDDLLAAARTAYSQHRLVAPASDNAMEYYEQVLAKDPKNQVAKDALRETFPFGVPDVEKAITANNFDEADRQIGVLAKADPTNYTLTLLRSKLDAAKKAQARQQAQDQEKAQKAAQAAVVAQQAAAKASAEKEAAAKLAAQQAEAAKAAPVAAKPVAAAPAAAAPKPAGITRGAKMVKQGSLNPPVQAVRNRTSGYAVVEFTVTTDGSVTNAHVVESQPRRLFDSAAVDTIKHSTFEPAMKDGQPTSAVLKVRIDFNLGG